MSKTSSSVSEHSKRSKGSEKKRKRPPQLKKVIDHEVQQESNILPRPKDPVGGGIRVLQLLPALGVGGVERGVVDIAVAVKKAGHESFVASSGGKKEADLEKAGVTHFRFKLASKNPLRILWNAFKLKKIIQQNHINLVHARSRAPGWSGYLAAKWCNVPFVTTFHGAYSLSPAPFKRWYNRVMVKGVHVIAISEFIRTHIMEHYQVPDERITVIHRGVDLETFDPAKVTASHIATIERYWKPHKDFPVILLPGRLTRLKGHLFLLDALSKIPHREYCCVFMGHTGRNDGKYLHEVRQKISDLGLRGNVTIVEPGGEMAAAYVRADVVVVASLRPEAFGRVAVEAQAMGVPVIATNLGGSKETIIDGQTGRLVDPEDSTLLAQLILDAIALSTKHRSMLAQATRKHVAEHFSLDDMIKETLAVYKNVLAQHGNKLGAEEKISRH